MKKCLLLSVLMFAAVMFTMAQTVVFSDNFDNYTAGAKLAQSNAAWTTWSQAPGSAEDGVISNTQASSAPNSLYITGSNDQVYPFGNYTTGHYTIAFNYYVPSTGSGAYFNIQHILLQQWACECYFYNNGTGYLTVGGIDYNFNYPSNSWFSILFDVDMDDNVAALTINDVQVNTWTFSYQSDNIGGTNQLAGINFYAGAPEGTGTYYVDDFVVTEISAALIGEFAVSSNDVTISGNPNATLTETLTLNNAGTGVTNYKVVPTYVIENPNPASTGATALMHYMDEPQDFIGFTDGAQLDIAVGFPSADLQSHIGRTLNEIDVFIASSLITNAKVRVYAMGNDLIAPGPGEVIYEQTFVPDSGWNYISLNTPILIDGGDLWFGVWMDQPAGTFPIALDGFNATDWSCWYKTSNGWKNKFVNYEENLCIGGVVDGTPIAPWLTVSPANGTIAAGAQADVTLNCNTNGMNEGETRAAKLHCFSTDLTNDVEVVNVALTITNVSVNDNNQIEVSIYPNPASDYLQISSDQINRVEIYNLMGQKVFDNTYSTSHVVVPADNMTAGTYVVTVTSNSGKTTKKVVLQ